MVAGNNAIDPAPLVDGSNQWLTWGNWQTGIDLLQLNTSTGKPLNSSRWDLVPGQVEAPYLHKDGSFYYLFFQRGLCCQGVNSGYYTVVGRSTSVTGPYLDKNGVSVLTGGSGAGSIFLPNRDGRYIGPGHVGYGEGRLTYHFYDGNDNGAPKLSVTTMCFSNGWPVAGGVNLPPRDSRRRTAPIKLRNRASGKYLDNLGATADGANVAQWAGGRATTSAGCSRPPADSPSSAAVTGGKYLDSIGRTADGSIVGQWANGSSPNQQWTIVPTGSYYKVINRANGKALDTGGQTADGRSCSSGSTTRATISSGRSSSSARRRRWRPPWPRSEVKSPTTRGTGAAVSSVQVRIDPRIRELSVTVAKGFAGEKRVSVEGRNGLVWAEGVFSGLRIR